jgi:succinate dehydrogenase hydrophobic anchor subunit
MDPMMTTVVAIAIVVVAFVVFVLVFRWIWNRTVPAVFGLKEITFWQALGILILASILTGGHRVVSNDITNIIAVPKRTGAASVTTILPG